MNFSRKRKTKPRFIARKHGNQLDFSDADGSPGGVIVSAVLVDDSGPMEEAGIGPLSLAKVKGIDPGERGQIQFLLPQTRHKRRKQKKEMRMKVTQSQ